jgi:hypothetical protein
LRSALHTLLTKPPATLKSKVNPLGAINPYQQAEIDASSRFQRQA